MKRSSERGYALIFVFAMSAMMAMTLYMELPRLALEMQRSREETLISRGEQYARAIKVFARKNKRYPQTIEELENTNGVRFLRRRYADPMTGKDEWRLIHADASGRLTDSLVQKTPVPGQTEEQKSANTFVSEGPTVGSVVDPAGGRVAQSLNRRASEQPGAPGGAPLPGMPTPADPNQPNQSTTQPYPSNVQGMPPGQQQLTQVQVPIMGPNGQLIQRIPGLPGQFGQQQPYPPQAANSQAGGVVPQQNLGGTSFGSGYGGAPPPPPPGTQQAQPYPQQAQPFPGGGVAPGLRPGAGAGGFPGGFPPQPAPPGGSPPGIVVNPATQLIQQILTRPNPQGLQNAMGAPAGTQGLGGGIAGVASKHDAEGIKIYNDKTNYKEWEFVYDPSKELKNAQGQIPGQIPGQGTGLQSPAGLSTQTGQGTGFGGQGGFGQSGGMGNPPGSGALPGGLGNPGPTRR